MSLQSGNVGSIRRYLLGELSEQEREQVEQRLLSDDALYQQLLLAEDDLIDEYISGELSDQELSKFRGRFLRVPQLRQDVMSMMALRKHALETPPRVTAGDSAATGRFSLFDWLGKFFMRPAVGVSFAAMTLAAIVLATWLGTQNSRLRRQVEQLQARQTPTPAPQQPDLQQQLASERQRNEQLGAELLRQQERLAEESLKLQQAQAQHRPTPTPGREPHSGVAAFFAFTLTPGAVRESGALKEISVPPDKREVRIRLDLAAADYRSYRAVLQTPEGRVVLSRRGLRAGRGTFVQFNIRATLLGPGDYQIRLSGVTPSGEAEDIDSYYFRVLE